MLSITFLAIIQVPNIFIDLKSNGNKVTEDIITYTYIYLHCYFYLEYILRLISLLLSKSTFI